MSTILINIDVSNLKAGIDFYTQAFNLTIGRKLGDQVIELLGMPTPIYLLEKAEGSSPTQKTADKRNYQRHWTPVHLDYVVESIEPAILRIKNAGATIESQVQVHSWGRIAHATDPFGNGFCIIEFVGRGYDEVAT